MTSTLDTAFWPTPGTVPSWGIPVPTANVAGVNVAGDPGVGNRRGLVIFCHQSLNSDMPIPLFIPGGAVTQGFISVQQFAAAVAAQAGGGWITWYPAQPVDYSKTAIGYAQSMANLVANDSLFGGRLVTVYGRWLSKLRARAASFYSLSSPPPTILVGFSLGAWVVAQLAINNASSILGYACHALPTEWDQLYQSPVTGGPGVPFQGLNCSGINLGSSALSGMTIPGIIGHAESGIAITSVSLAGTALTVGTASTPPWTPGTTNVTIDSAAGGTWGTAGTSGLGINGTWAVASGSGTSWVLTYTNGGAAPTGTYTASSGQSLPSGVYTDGVVGWTSSTTPPSNGSLIAASAGGTFTSYATREGNTAYPNAHLFGNADATTYSNWIQSTFNSSHSAFF